MTAERQVTHGSRYDHELDNNDNFSPDDRFLVFDTRTADGGPGASRAIGRVEIESGEIVHLYDAPDPSAFGPGVAAASYSHVDDEVIFIHGPLRATSEENQYEKHRRVGVIAAGDGSGRHRQADARDTRRPFTPGALRGGTHRHEFSRDGGWVGFTYNDAVLHDLGEARGEHLDLRTIGVTRLGRPVHGDASDPQFVARSDGFSVLVVVVVPSPEPGSDEILHAAHDSWVGSRGYRRAGDSSGDGARQRARAFLGTVRGSDGEDVDELFIVDIPEDITRPGRLGPLEGTASAFPMPPLGTAQRRLTRTADSRYPGCKGIVRASHDGERIAFQMRDALGAWQVFLISPRGGESRQATSIEGGVSSGVRWHPSGNSIVATAGSAIVVTVVQEGPLFGKSVVLSDRAPTPFALVWSHDGKTIAYNRRVETSGRAVTQVFVDEFPDADGDGIPDELR